MRQYFASVKDPVFFPTPPSEESPINNADPCVTAIFQRSRNWSVSGAMHRGGGGRWRRILSLSSKPAPGANSIAGKAQQHTDRRRPINSCDKFNFFRQVARRTLHSFPQLARIMAETNERRIAKGPTVPQGFKQRGLQTLVGNYRWAPCELSAKLQLPNGCCRGRKSRGAPRAPLPWSQPRATNTGAFGRTGGKTGAITERP